MNSRGVEYLLIGGYAVFYHGHSRFTADIDLWVALAPENAARVEAAVRSLGYNLPGMKSEWFLRKGAVLRIGQEPLRFDIVNEISGVSFADCYARRIETEIEGVPVKIISLADLKNNKKASGRHKDLDDVEHLP